MDWFDGLSYDGLKTWVPTAGVVPRNAAHAVARLKGAILQEMLASKAAGDGAGHQRAWKALTFVDRMLFAQAPGRASKRRKGTRADTVTSRVRRAWRGDWGALLAEADAMGQGVRGAQVRVKGLIARQTSERWRLTSRRACCPRLWLGYAGGFRLPRAARLLGL